MALDLSSLQKAVGSLERAMRVADRLIEGKVDTDQEEVIRAGVIQNFEFTYDQSIKFIVRWLEVNIAGSDPDHKTFKDVLRMGVESQLIDNIDDWIEYRDARNETSHTYDNDKADDVFNVTKTFLKDAQQLLKTLEMKKIDVAERDLKTILALLDKHVPECEVRAFGSRVAWTAKDHSDLDLVIVGPEKLERGQLDDLKEALAESSVPFRVDVMDWHRISEQFHRNIEKNFKVIKSSVVKTASSWPSYKVSEFAEVIGGGTPKTGVAEYWNGNIPWITPKDLSSHQGRYIARGERNLTEEGLKNSSARLVPANTVLLTSRAPVGYLAIAQNPVTTNQGFRSLVVKEGFSPEFIYYLLLHNVEYLKQHASGSTFQELSGGTLKNLQFCIPDLKIQKKIAQTLSDLDAKIELNQQMNKTLETMAQLLFKQWFVDFEFPNEEGQPYMSSGGKMVGSELGKIPEGWETASLTDIVDVLGGGTPSTGVPSYWDGETPFFTPRDVSESCYTIKTDKNVTKEGLDHCNSALFPQDTVFITARGTVGKVCMAGVPMAMNQSCYAIKGKNFNQLFVFLMIKDITQKLLQQAHGTVFETITTQTFQRTMAIKPTIDVVDLFYKKVKPLYGLILDGMKNSEMLCDVRDSLLRKLMSGLVKIEN